MLKIKHITPSESIKSNELNKEGNTTHKIVCVSNSLDKISTQENICIDNLLLNKQSDLGLDYLFRDNVDKFDEPVLLKNRLQHSLIRNGRRWSTGDINETEIKYTEQVTLQNNGIWFPGSTFIESTSFNVNDDGSVSAHTLIPEIADFLVVYSKSIWVIFRSFKYNKTTHFFMSEVIRMQFKIASKIGGFEGTLPSIIGIKNIINTNASLFMEKHKHVALPFKGAKKTKNLISEFLSLDGNGKSTAHILNSFEMQAIDIDIDSGSFSIYIHVTPIK